MSAIRNILNEMVDRPIPDDKTEYNYRLTSSEDDASRAELMKLLEKYKDNHDFPAMPMSADYTKWSEVSAAARMPLPFVWETIEDSLKYGTESSKAFWERHCFRGE